ncbi:hypothetical protein HDA40_005380 [Hamadaea flava]|uniref:Lipoprotein n=1 Tax=Hamadaea flava TaxID=1742688 RepID=A0ABV8M039_9ACTN|nr:hypothetical protein [Hamadaea flava]MCP2326873.1 hypothetical protein [Hamadaea flava]
MTGLPLRLAAVLAAVALAGCSGGTPSSQAPSVTTTVGPSDSPSATESPSGATTTTPTPGSSKPGGSTFTIPTTAKGYAQALLSAWGNKNSSRLDLLANQATVQQIKDNGYPNADWTYIDCTASGETSECVFRNAHGDEVLVSLVNTQLGHPTAATQALLSRTTYPSDAGAYVGAFLSAWQNGNQQRMARLGSSSVTSALKGKTVPSGYTTSVSGSTVRIEQLPAGAGPTFVFTVVSGNLGKAHAISAAGVS